MNFLYPYITAGGGGCYDGGGDDDGCDAGGGDGGVGGRVKAWSKIPPATLTLRDSPPWLSMWAPGHITKASHRCCTWYLRKKET